MAISTEAALQEIDELLSRARLRAGQPLSLGQFGSVPGFSDGEVAAITTAWLAAVERLTAPGSPYRGVAISALEPHGPASGYTLVELVGVMNAIRTDWDHGYMGSVAQLIHADVFADFLEMAQELLEKRFKDAAAVITGSVLEEHLRKLCDKHGVSTQSSDAKPKKADLLNAELMKVTAYNKLVQKQITAWLDLRNKAAHGHYTEYTLDQVRLMLDGVRQFIISSPA